MTGRDSASLTGLLCAEDLHSGARGPPTLSASLALLRIPARFLATKREGKKKKKN